MIRASFEYDLKGRIYSFRMEGHARSFRPWPDVICAGVSAIAQTTIGSLEELAGVSPRYTLESGWICCEVTTPKIQHEDCRHINGINKDRLSADRSQLRLAL